MPTLAVGTLRCFLAILIPTASVGMAAEPLKIDIVEPLECPFTCVPRKARGNQDYAAAPASLPFPPLDLADKLILIPLSRGDKIVTMRDIILPNCGLE
jgi:hypothetical protein